MKQNASLHEIYELAPANGRKSFGGKAVVEVLDDGARVLRSYGTPVIRWGPNGTLHRLYDGWSATTGHHIQFFCGLDKAAYNALPYEPMK